MDAMEGEIAEAAKRVLARLKGALSKLTDPVGDGIDYEEKAREDVKECCGGKLDAEDAEEDLKERVLLFGLAMNKLLTVKDKAERKKMKDFAKDDVLTKTLEGIFISNLGIEAVIDLKDYYIESFQIAVKTTISEYTQRLHFQKDAALKKGEVQDVSRILDLHGTELGAGTVTQEALLCTAYRLGNAQLHREAAAEEQAREPAAEAQPREVAAFNMDEEEAEESSSTGTPGVSARKRGSNDNGESTGTKKSRGGSYHDKETKDRIKDIDAYLKSRNILNQKDEITPFIDELNGMADAPFILRALYTMGWCNMEEPDNNISCAYSNVFKVRVSTIKGKAPAWVFPTTDVPDTETHKCNVIESWTLDTMAWFWLLCIVLSRNGSNREMLRRMCAAPEKARGQVSRYQRGKNRITQTLNVSKTWVDTFHKLRHKCKKPSNEHSGPIANANSKEIVPTSLLARECHHTVNLVFLDCLCMLQQEGYESLWRGLDGSGRISITTGYMQESVNGMYNTLEATKKADKVQEECKWATGTVFKARNVGVRDSTKEWMEDFMQLVAYQENLVSVQVGQGGERTTIDPALGSEMNKTED